MRRSSVPIDPVYVPTPSRSDEGAIISRYSKKAIASPRVRTLTLLWILGLFCMLWAPAPVAVTDEMKRTYEAKVIDAAHPPHYDEVYTEVQIAEVQLADAQVWFWRFRPEHRAVVHVRQAILDKARVKLDQLEATRDAKMREAKAYVGLWSDYGLDEARRRFWVALNLGKEVALQQTSWDMMLSVLQPKDDQALTAIVNFTIALIFSLFYFTISLLWMVFKYNPDPLSAVAFIALALLGGVSVVVTYLLAMYALVASSFYIIVKIATESPRLLDEERQPMRLRWETFTTPAYRFTVGWALHWICLVLLLSTLVLMLAPSPDCKDDMRHLLRREGTP
ncbi:hypothetical protein AC1031_002705 [Aphanomyces cochlioides]|nr:hypothetical protein AC1031_002705 [Aphanomyces cochlioides]